jgi:tRNA (mo5U34)-methyltransferase
MLANPMNPLPTQPDDPRLEGWYHTIELAPGVTTQRAIYDHSSIVHGVGMPESLAGKSALDIGTADGYWAFEMERRGASPVVALELSKLGDSDVLPSVRDRQGPEWHGSPSFHGEKFATAHAMRGSKIEYRHGTIYDLSPKSTGTFDVVFCGSLLLHLFSPLEAMLAIRSITREMAIIETITFHPSQQVEKFYPGQPLAWFGEVDQEQVRGRPPGSYCVYWRFSATALSHMMMYAGFSRTEPQETQILFGYNGGSIPVTSVVGYV